MSSVATDRAAFIGLFPSLLADVIDEVRADYPDFDPLGVEWFKQVRPALSSSTHHYSHHICR